MKRVKVWLSIEDAFAVNQSGSNYSGHPRLLGSNGLLSFWLRQYVFWCTV